VSANVERSPWVGFSAVAVGTLMATVDGSIVSVALPSMHRDLGASYGGVELVVTAYLLAVSAALLAAGRLGDVAGHRRVFVGGLLIFTAGSALCGLAPGLSVLVAARLVQALGAAAMMAIGPAALTALFPASHRGRALGAITTVVAVGLSAGPPLGGFLVQSLSWRWIFWVNLPIGVAGAVWASRALPETSRGGGRMDLPGAALLAAAVAAAVAAAQSLAAAPGRAALLAAGSAAAGAALARRSRGAPWPVFDAALFARRDFGVGVLAVLLSYAALFTATLMNPYFLSQVKGLPPLELGAVLTVVPIALSVSSPLSGWLADRFPTRALGPAGMGLVALGLGGLGTAGAGITLGGFAARLALLGLGMGLFQPPNNAAVMGSLPRERLGSGGGMLATSRNLGMALGVAAAGAVFRARAGPSPEALSFLRGYQAALLAGAALALLAGLVSVFVRPAGFVDH
jgi:EmrB/QacA subfamily drug resistance transporter